MTDKTVTTIWFAMLVVYFDKCLGDAHSKCWFKYTPDDQTKHNLFRE